MLDIDHGTYPFVFLSNTVAAQAATGSGTGPSNIHFTLGITKAYTTRVGKDHFLQKNFRKMDGAWEKKDANLVLLQVVSAGVAGSDAVMVRQAGMMAGITGIALTKLDVLDGFETLKICIGYEVDGKRIDYFPTNIKTQKSCNQFMRKCRDGGKQPLGSFLQICQQMLLNI